MKLQAIGRLVFAARARAFAGRSVLALSYTLPLGALAAGAAAPAVSLELLAPVVAARIYLAAGAFSFVVTIAYALAGLADWPLLRLLDDRGDLKDRLSNAVQFARRERPTPLMELAMADGESAAAALRLSRLLPLWSRGNTARFAWRLLLGPLIYTAGVYHLADWLGKQAAEEPDLIEAAAPMPAELAADGFNELGMTSPLLPPITQLHGITGDWRGRLAKLRERSRQARPLTPEQEPMLPETIYKQDMANLPGKQREQVLAADGLPAVRYSNRLHPSDLRALGEYDAEVDQSMQLAFRELDETLLDLDPKLEDVAKYVEEMKEESGRNKSTAAMNLLGSTMAAGGKNDKDALGSFRNATQAAQQDSFNEFLEEYAKHLDRMVQAKQDINQQRANAQGPVKRQILAADQGQKLPPQGELRMVKMDDASRKDVKLDNQIGQQFNSPGDPLKAGKGGGTFRGAIKVKHETELAAVRKEVLKGQQGEGKATVQILEDVQDAQPETYDRLLARYQQDAQEALADSLIPTAVRSYVQQYLSSLSLQGGHSGNR